MYCSRGRGEEWGVRPEQVPLCLPLSFNPLWEDEHHIDGRETKNERSGSVEHVPAVSRGFLDKIPVRDGGGEKMPEQGRRTTAPTKRY